MINHKDGKVIGTGTTSRGNVFYLNPTEMTWFIVKLDES